MKRLALVIVVFTILLVVGIGLWSNGDTIGGQPNTQENQSPPMEDVNWSENEAADSKITSVETQPETESEPINQDIAVEFPDGERVVVSICERPEPLKIPNLRKLKLDLVESYNLLREAADDDNGSAAFQLWGLLAGCDRWLKKDDGIEESIARIYQEGFYFNPWGGSFLSDMLPGDKRDATAAARRHFDECGVIIEQNTQSLDELLENAVELGDSQAMKKFGSTAGRTESAVRAFEQAWLAGEIFATTWLADLYQRGWLDATGRFVQDPVQSFAYRFLFVELLVARNRKRGGAEGMYEEMCGQQLAESERILLPQDRERAYSLAKSMLQGNDICFRAF